MLIKSLKLENVRSYLNEEINFPAGATLLCGDIGSGKSSILLALEFALFGIMKGDLTGASLLRHGAKEGSVELKFDIDGEEILVKRYLKRGKDAVSQDNGYFIKNGLKTEGSALEIKAKILDLLGYPKEFLTKSKSMIYRYTVYTPQEEMKNILTEDDDQRLNTLRKVFGIDRYKQITENTSIVNRNLREKKKEIEGKVFDLPSKEKQKTEYHKLVLETKDKVLKIEPTIKEVKEQKESKKIEIKKVEEEINKFNNLKKELATLDAKLKEKIEQQQNNLLKLNAVDEEISILKSKLNKDNIEDLKKLISEKESIRNKVKESEDTLLTIRAHIKECELNKSNSEKIKNQILNLNECPTCLQSVSNEYKQNISSKEDEKIRSSDSLLNKHIEDKNTKEKELKELKTKFDSITENESKLSRFQIESRNLNEKNDNKQEILEEQEQTKIEVEEINVKKLELNQEIGKLTNVSDVYLKLKKEFDEILSKEKQFEIEKARYDKEIKISAKL